MVLRLYNTLTRRKEEFQPLDPANVRMYVCGPTVYDFAHIGNARPVIVFDVLYRLLKYLAKRGEWRDGKDNTKIVYVRNITDVDDKINGRALRDYPDLPLNEAIRRVTERTARRFHADVNALGCLKPTVEPRATDNIAQMIEMISTLIKRGHAYEAGGEVLFSVGSMPDYGQLSQRKLADQQAGARVAVDAHKKNPADFVLWKLSSADEPGWDSPWGRGRPGWHIECSAMSKRYLGEVFDIHGGGLDLIFPHHENEIAQSRCAHGTAVMARTWMHNGFLQVEGQKMSKSLGNFVTINELLTSKKFGGRSWSGMVVRMAMLQTHYRQPIDWTVRQLEQAEVRLKKWSQFAFAKTLKLNNRETHMRAISALLDDLNTPELLAVIDEVVESRQQVEANRYTVFQILELLGFGRMKTNVIRAEESAAALLKRLAKITEGEFQNLIIEVNERPTFSDGGLKPETNLTTSLVAIEKFARKHFAGVKLTAEIEERVREREAQAISRSTVTEKLIINLIAARLEARKAKNWVESDRIRDELAAMGIAIKDNKDGTTTWEVKR